MIAATATLPIERAFVAFLKKDPALASLEIVSASDREVLVPPVHCFVACDTVTPQLPAGPIYMVDVVVTLVTNIDEDPTSLREQLWTYILANLRTDPEAQQFEHGGVLVKGWSIKTIGEVSSGQQTGDVARLTAGIVL